MYAIWGENVLQVCCAYSYNMSRMLTEVKMFYKYYTCLFSNEMKFVWFIWEISVLFMYIITSCYYLCILLHHVTHLLAFVYAFNVLLINTVTAVMSLTLQCEPSRFVLMLHWPCQWELINLVKCLKPVHHHWHVKNQLKENTGFER